MPKRNTTKAQLLAEIERLRGEQAIAGKVSYRHLVAHALDLITVIDETGVIHYKSPSVTRLLGYDQAELLGRSVLDIIHAEDQAQVTKAIASGFAEAGRREEVRCRVRHKRGHWCWLEAIGSAHITLDGGKIAVISSRDISQQMAAEDALRESEARFRTLFEQSPFPMQIIDRSGRTLGVNKAWQALWGVEQHAIEDFNLLQDEQLRAKGIIPYIERAFAGEAVTIPAIYFDPRESAQAPRQARARWVRAWAYPLRTDKGEAEQVVLVHEDISERKRLLEQSQNLADENRRLALALMDAREEERRTLAREIHDELGQRFALLKMEMGRAAGHSKEPARLQESLRWLETTLDEAMAFTRSLVQQLHPAVLESMGLADALADLCSNWQKQTGIACRLHCPERLPRLGEKMELCIYRAVQECLTNAARHAKASKVRVSLALARRKGKRALALTVADDGRGMAADQRYGLGLIGMRERVLALGGGLDIAGRPDQGTCVHIRLPLKAV